MNDHFNSLTKYCITISSTPDRLKGFLDHTKEKGLKNFGIYFGLHPAKAPKMHPPEGCPTNVGAFMLTLNHYALWNCVAMHPEREKKFVIFEDDVVFNLDDYDPVLARLPKDADWVSLGTQTNLPFPKKLDIAFEKKTYFPCTHAYIITPNSASKLVLLTEGTDMWDTVDFYVIKNFYKRINAYVSTWPLVGQRTIKYTTRENKIEWPSLISPEAREQQ